MMNWFKEMYTERIKFCVSAEKTMLQILSNRQEELRQGCNLRMFSESSRVSRRQPATIWAWEERNWIDLAVEE
jgi:hypothetical protein